MNTVELSLFKALFCNPCLRIYIPANVYINKYLFKGSEHEKNNSFAINLKSPLKLDNESCSYSIYLFWEILSIKHSQWKAYGGNPLFPSMHLCSDVDETHCCCWLGQCYKLIALINGKTCLNVKQHFALSEGDKDLIHFLFLTLSVTMNCAKDGFIIWGMRN